jgi:MFS superfamily sulfate permease-like transporter
MNRERKRMELQWVLNAIIAAVAAGIVGAISWLVREVLAIRQKLVEVETTAIEWRLKVETALREVQEQKQSCMVTFSKLFSTLSRLDRNIVRLCEKASVTYEKE